MGRGMRELSVAKRRGWVMTTRIVSNARVTVCARPGITALAIAGSHGAASRG